MKEVYGYIRVSTARQGEKGVSLTEQKEAIERFATKNSLEIVQWFEERETAAKRGRKVFTDMITLLKKGKASGVIVHKIDRSARNLRDWADIVDLSDQGIDIHFANEAIDLSARGGRLSADIQAVVAADYVRNLREETLKGIRGRLKQGYYPWSAPIGYINTGGGKKKEICPKNGPLVKKVFESYASGKYSLNTLVTYAKDIGLTNRAGSPVSVSGMSKLLNNPFYIGILATRTSEETFQGNHEPLINTRLYDKVQMVLRGKTVKGTGDIGHTYRRMFKCVSCTRSVIGERQKRHVYYRCHQCRGVCIKETEIIASIESTLAPFDICKHDETGIDNVILQMTQEDADEAKIERDQLQLQKDSLQSRLSRLTDAFIDGDVDRSLYFKKKADLLKKSKNIDNSLTHNTSHKSSRRQEWQKNLELYKGAWLSYSFANEEKKRLLLTELTSNLSAEAKSVVVELNSPFLELCELKKSSKCRHCRKDGRYSDSAPEKSRSISFSEKIRRMIEADIATYYALPSLRHSTKSAKS